MEHPTEGLLWGGFGGGGGGMRRDGEYMGERGGEKGGMFPFFGGGN